MEIGKITEVKRQESSRQKKVVLIAAGIVVFSLFIIGAFYVGKSRLSNTSPTPTPTPFSEITQTPTPIPTTTPAPTKKPTPKPTKTPTKTPTPTPTPPAGPTPTPTPVTFSVTAVSATIADPSSFSGSCPHLFTFSGSITANAAGSVSYKWERSDGVAGPVVNLTFTGAGSLAVSADTWNLGLPGSSTSGWERIKVETPNSTTSNQVAFTLSCT